MAKHKGISILVSVCLLLSGCGWGSQPGTDSTQEESILSLEKEPDLSYTVPASVPGVLVNQVGYLTGSTKIVIFRGKELPVDFQVIDAESGQAVFTDTVKDKGYDEAAEVYFGYGDFSDLNETGEYYIECSLLGQSYPFLIGDGLYDSILEETIEYFNGSSGDKKINVSIPGDTSDEKIIQGGWYTDEEDGQELIPQAEAVNVALISWELYPQAFLKNARDKQGVPELFKMLKREIDWMLQLQDEKSGGVYGGIVSIGQPGAGYYSMLPISTEASAGFASALARFSYAYKEFDKEYAALCLKAADLAWRYIEKQKEEKPGTRYFCAAAELYRASGQYKYHTAVKRYLESEPDRQTEEEARWASYGAVTYISTRHTVDINLCAELMDTLMQQAEQISQTSHVGFYLASGNSSMDNTEELLWNMVILSIADYVITNHEYATVIENHQHYFLGRNQQALCLLAGKGSRSAAQPGKAIRDNLTWNAYYLCVLSQILKDE